MTAARRTRLVDGSLWLLLGLLLAGALALALTDAGRTREEQLPERVARLEERLADVQRDAAGETARNYHARISVIEAEIETHGRLLWLVLGSVVGKALADFWTGKRMRANLHALRNTMTGVAMAATMPPRAECAECPFGRCGKPG